MQWKWFNKSYLQKCTEEANDGAVLIRKENTRGRSQKAKTNGTGGRLLLLNLLTLNTIEKVFTLYSILIGWKFINGYESEARSAQWLRREAEGVRILELSSVTTASLRGLQAAKCVSP